MAQAAEWDLRKLQMSLEKGQLSPIYLLYGEEIFLVDQAMKALKEKILADGATDFNYDNFSAPEVTPAQVRDAVEMLPMMCPRRFVVYKHIDAIKDEAWEALMPVIDNPIDTTTLILVATKIDKRKKFFKKLADTATFVDLKKPFENQIPSWIEYISYLNDVKISGDAAGAIQQLVGTNLSEINNEVQKIKQYLDGKKTVSLEDVLKVVSRSRIENVFTLTDAIANRDRSKALLCLANLMENGQNEIGILSLIYRQMRILSSVQEGMRQGLSGLRLSQKVGVPEFFLKQYVAQSRAWDAKKIKDTMKALHETDLALKSSPVSSHIWLENFVVRTC